MSSGYEIAKEKDIRELFDLQLRAFESEAEMIGSRNVPALMESLEENRADFRNWTVLVKRNDEGRIIGAVRFREESDHIEIGDRPRHGCTGIQEPRCCDRSDDCSRRTYAGKNIRTVHLH